MGKFKAEAPKIRIEDHYEFGRVLQMFKLKLIDKLDAKGTKKEQRECNEAKALRKIEELKNYMDEILFKEHPQEKVEKLSPAYYREE